MSTNLRHETQPLLSAAQRLARAICLCSESLFPHGFGSAKPRAVRSWVLTHRSGSAAVWAATPAHDGQNTAPFATEGQEHRWLVGITSEAERSTERGCRTTACAMPLSSARRLEAVLDLRARQIMGRAIPTCWVRLSPVERRNPMTTRAAHWPAQISPALWQICRCWVRAWLGAAESVEIGTT